jgi:azurin
MNKKSLMIPALFLYGSIAMAAPCSYAIEGNDQMQFNTKEIKVDASCTEVEITLKHAGKLPKQTMGHGFALTKTADMQAVIDAGKPLGMDHSYLPKDDPRLIASIGLIGGGETATVKFPSSKLEKGGDYTFFCPYPGHWTMMKGKLVFG